jgi:hypothetical protein
MPDERPQLPPPVGTRDEMSQAAILEDRYQSLCRCGGIDRHIRAARLHGPIHCDRRVDSLIHVDADAISSLQPLIDQHIGQLARATRELRVRKRLVEIANGLAIRFRVAVNQLGEQLRRHHLEPEQCRDYISLNVGGTGIDDAADGIAQIALDLAGGHIPVPALKADRVEARGNEGLRKV